MTNHKSHLALPSKITSKEKHYHGSGVNTGATLSFIQEMELVMIENYIFENCIKSAEKVNIFMRNSTVENIENNSVLNDFSHSELKINDKNLKTYFCNAIVMKLYLCRKFQEILQEIIKDTKLNF